MVLERSTGEPAPAPEKLLEVFLKAQADASSVHDLEQRLELHVSGTSGYLPSYTRHVMDKSYGAPVMAIETRTDDESKCLFLQPVNPNERRGRKLRKDDTLGPVEFALGVPLRKLGIKLPASRRVILPLTALETPDHGIVYWASFAGVEHERSGVDMDLVAAAKQSKAEQAQARKADRLTKATAKPATGAEA